MLTIGRMNELPGVRHAFFSREGGVSEGLYASLNCGLGSKDEPDKVRRNRALAMEHLELEAGRLATPYQTHSAIALPVETPWAPGEAPEADALVTSRTELAIGVSTADCVPVLLVDAEARVAGAAHAGWKGALGGIVEATVEAMAALGAAPKAIVAGIGPAICQRSYEVGPEFPAPFLAADPDSSDLFCPAPRAGHFHFDLKGYVARRLARLGLAAVDTLPCDTCSEEHRFFSYRRACQRGEPDYGRSLSVIYLEP